MHDFATLLQDLFTLKLPLLEKIIRPIIVYFALVVLLRIFGKRELAQLNPFDLVVLLSLSNTVQNAIIGDDSSLSGGLLGAVSLLATNYLVVRFMFKHRRLDELAAGSPTTLIERGKLRRSELAKELLTETELTAVAHRQGFTCLDDVETCRLEPGGVFYLEGKEPRTEIRQHKELLAKLEAIQKKVEELSKR